MPAERFLTLSDVADILNISGSQTYALVRNGDLPAIKIGGRGQWRVERSQLESYIERLYDETKRFVEEHPLGREEIDAGLDDEIRPDIDAPDMKQLDEGLDLRA